MATKPPTLPTRIAALHREMEREIDAYIVEAAQFYRGLPRDVIRHCEVGWRTGECLCKAYKNLAERNRLR